MDTIESKSQSFWWDSHICQENFKWLAEHREGFEQNAKEILKLLEQEGISSKKISELYDHKKPELIIRIAEFSHMHKELAERYERLMGEVCSNPPSLTEMAHLNICDSISPQSSQMPIPDHMNSAQKFSTPIGFDVLLSSGDGGSDVSQRECSESSFSLSSDADSESFNKLIASPVKDDALKAKEAECPEVFLGKIAHYEAELVGLNTDLHNSDETNSKPDLKENKTVTELASTMQPRLDLGQHEIKTQNDHFETELKMVALQKQVGELQIVISDSNGKIGAMGEELETSRKKLIVAEGEISKLRHELSSKISEETQRLQGQLESTKRDMAFLQGQLYAEKNKVLELQEEVSLHIADIAVRDDQIRELNTKIKHSKHEISMMKSAHKAKEDSWKVEAERLKVELKGKCESIEDLNKSLDTFKQKHDAVMSQKDGVDAQLDTLRAEMRSQANSMKDLQHHLNTLQAEHVGVTVSFESARKLTNELQLKVEELEGAISDRAEEKREAIRQLCFSLEHYRCAYKELLQTYIGHKRHAGLAP